MEKFSIKCQRGVDDLLLEYAFTGNSQGDESRSNDINDYIAAKGWLSYNFKNIDVTDQAAIYREALRRSELNLEYISKLKKEGRYKEEYTLDIYLEHNPLYDDPEIMPHRSMPLSSFRMLFLNTNDNNMEQSVSPETQELLNEVDNFASAMKQRLIEKGRGGYSGWKNYDPHDIALAIELRLPRLVNPSDSESGVELGIANWALINFVNRKNK